MALKSYGVYAAKLAGLPNPVIRRAEELLQQYENEDQRPQTGEQAVYEDELRKKLSEIDIDSLSPIEALMKLYELKNVAKQEKKVENKKHLKRAIG